MRRTLIVPDTANLSRKSKALRGDDGVAVLDLGKTSCRLHITSGSEVTAIHTGSGVGAPGLAEPQGLSLSLGAVSALLKATPAPIVHQVTKIVIGAAGAAAAAHQTREFAAEVSRLYSADVAVCSDSVIAHVGALGGGGGTVIVAGTGSVVCSLDTNGQWRQVDGWGPWLGDDGSGQWIGQQGLRAVLRSLDGRGPQTSLSAEAAILAPELSKLPAWLSQGDGTARSLATFAPTVIEHATRGDEVASKIVTQAAQHLAHSAVVAQTDNQVVTAIGGLIEHPYFLSTLTAALESRERDLSPAQGTALDGGMLIAKGNTPLHDAQIIRVSHDGNPDSDRNRDLAQLTTESVDSSLADLDRRTTTQLVNTMNDENAQVAGVVASTTAAMVLAVDGIVDRLKIGGRLIYVGAGTPGRIGILDASECPPTFGVDRGVVVGVIAGGPNAIVGAVENAEDDPKAGAHDLEHMGVGPNDAVVGISASGRTPYVLGAMSYAAGVGALTIAVSSNTGSELAKGVDIPIDVVVGPELIAGSTRLKAGTAQKLVLNTLSTISMIRLGKTFGNLMVDLNITNDKLRARAEHTVMVSTGSSREDAQQALVASGDSVKLAILMLKTRTPRHTAQEMLDAHEGHLTATLDSFHR